MYIIGRLAVIGHSHELFWSANFLRRVSRGGLVS